MDYMALVAQRYSCKRYDPRPVPEEILTQILEAGGLPPRQRICRSRKSMSYARRKVLRRSMPSPPAGTARRWCLW